MTWRMLYICAISIRGFDSVDIVVFQALEHVPAVHCNDSFCLDRSDTNFQVSTLV